MEATSEPDLDDKRLAGWSGDGPADGGHTLGERGASSSDGASLGAFGSSGMAALPCCRRALEAKLAADGGLSSGGAAASQGECNSSGAECAVRGLLPRSPFLLVGMTAGFQAGNGESSSGGAATSEGASNSWGTECR